MRPCCFSTAVCDQAASQAQSDCPYRLPCTLCKRDRRSSRQHRVPAYGQSRNSPESTFVSSVLRQAGKRTDPQPHRNATTPHHTFHETHNTQHNTSRHTNLQYRAQHVDDSGRRLGEPQGSFSYACRMCERCSSGNTTSPHQISLQQHGDSTLVWVP